MMQADTTLNRPITRDQLVGKRWIWAEIGRATITNSFYFGDDGRIEVYRHENERSWTLTDGVLRIFHDAGIVMWTCEASSAPDGALMLIARNPNIADTFSLTEYKGATRIAPDEIDLVVEAGEATTGPEAVRLVIWDMDDTFWTGTLSEGEIEPIQVHLELIRTLTRRGIVNSICSKNDHDAVERKLRELGIWDEFVFPEISWSAKGAMVKNIIRNAQLRPASVMFIDDNVTNLNEAKFYVADLQVAEPSAILGLLDDPRFVGKPDPSSSRLARYKVLESKAVEKVAFKGDNENFLRNSQVTVSFHADVEAQFARVHDLVNRTNQLNFTKRRWSENADEAREQFRTEIESDFYSHSGYVKVSDRYGQYGICGFYLVSNQVCAHLLFSCRTMNMGVEQFVWNRLGRPYVPVQGAVISDIDMPVDWIEVVEDADRTDDTHATSGDNRLTVCIRGGCDMTMMSNFLKTRVDTIEELNYAYQGWEIATQPRLVALYDELDSAENQAIVARLPGLPPQRFKTDLVTGQADVYVLSFSQESFHGTYRARSTGLTLPMGHFGLGHNLAVKMNYTALSYQDILNHGVSGVSQDQWEFFTSEFEFLGGYDPTTFVADARKVLTDLRRKDKHVIVVGLNSTVGRDQPILDFFAGINVLIEPLAADLGCDYIDINAIIGTEDDLANDGQFGGPHFGRHVYLEISHRVLALIRSRTVERGVAPI